MTSSDRLDAMRLSPGGAILASLLTTLSGRLYLLSGDEDQ